MHNATVEFFRKLHIYQKRSFRFDFLAAIVVFLVAIPLCLGIALASGAPLFSGILSGIIGGVIVGSLSGSNVSISGPATGMAVIVFGAIMQLNGFNNFLLALLLAGILQILAGYFRAGFIADYIPSNVIQGFLSAVGILLIIKQLPFALTLSHSLSGLKTELIELSTSFELQPLHDLTMHINSGAVILSLSSLFVLIYIDASKKSLVKILPGPFVVVLMGIIFNEIFILFDSGLAQLGPHLANIPKHDGFYDFFSQMQTPSFSRLTDVNIYIAALIIATISSMENLVNIKAGETLDKKHLNCSKDRELMAQGVGNICAGLVGGIPVTSVIVRTSVNIRSGSKTKVASILQGIFLLTTVLLIPDAINKIPLSSLAAVLIYVGYKLTSPNIYLKIYKQGMDRFIPFLTTVIAIIIFNLLVGIIIGVLVSLFFILKSSSQARLDIIKEIYPKGETNRLVLPQQTTFLNKATLVAELDSIPPRSQLIIDASYSEYIDKEIIEFIQEFKDEHAPHKNISLNLIGFKDNYQIHNYVDFINVTTYNVQSNLSASKVLNILKEGNERFQNGTRIHRCFKADVKNTAKTQHPIAVVLGCIDSRVPVETIFDMSFGDLFCVRIAGNVVNDDILASIEYACHVIGAKLIVVLGHTSCGAIKAACDEVEHGHITQLLSKIKPAIAAETYTTTDRTGKNHHFVHKVTQLNIANTMANIHQKSDILKNLINDEQIGMVGALYDVNSGEAQFNDFSPFLKQLQDPNTNKLADKLKKVLTAANRDFK
ncbi:MAG: carbonic anhydrase family protein [Legionellaceae bacterium]|nr:carbonic anhydrase family protein [Legionellaceae bacterium]